MAYVSQYSLYKSQCLTGGMSADDFAKCYDAKLRKAQAAFPQADFDFHRYKADQSFWKSHVPRRLGAFRGINPVSGRLSPISKEERLCIETAMNNPDRKREREHGRDRDRGHGREREHERARARAVVPQVSDCYTPRSPHGTYRGRSSLRSEGRERAPIRDDRSKSPPRLSWADKAKVLNEQVEANGKPLIPIRVERLCPDKLGSELSLALPLATKRAACSDMNPFGAGTALPSPPIGSRNPAAPQVVSPPAKSTPLMLSRGAAPAQGRKYLPIPLSTKEDKLYYLRPFFASQNGWPRFCSVCAQPNASIAFSLTSERLVGLEREFPRMKFRSSPFPEGLAVWVEPALPTQKAGFVLPEAYREILEIGAKLLRAYSGLRVAQLPPIDVFVRDYFAGRYDEPI